MSLQQFRFIQVPFFLILSITVFHSIASAQEKPSQVFSGRVINAESKTPVSYAMISIRHSIHSTYSDSMGNFSILVSKGDTLQISRLGYYPAEIPITDILLLSRKIHTIELTIRPYELKSVTISSLGTYQQFKYNVIHAELPENEMVINPAITNSFNKKVIVIEPQARIPLGSPVTAIYMLLSKEGKTLRKLEKEEEKDKEIASYKHKFSAEIISNLTGLKDLEVEKFIKYCNFDMGYIKEAHELDIAEKIMECYKRYKAEVELNAPATP